MTLPGPIVDLVLSAKTIAVVGCSPRPQRDSHSVARYLQGQGYKVIPVNPGHEEILGVRAYRDLRSAQDAEGPIDIVDIFRRSLKVGPHVEEAIAVGVGLIWMPLGVVSEEAAARARQAGIPVVMDRCLRVEHAALQG